MKRSWPIIIGGCFRSGTSLVRRLLNAHPRIHCGPEVKFFRDFYNDYQEDPLSHLRFMTSARTLLPESELLDVLTSAYIKIHKRAADLAGKKRWADKTPENVLYLREWQQALGGEWHFVHVVRNPLDTMASIKETPFPLTISEDLEGRIDMYRTYTEAGLEFVRKHPQRCRVLMYEQLVESPEQTCRDLMEWLGELFSPSQLDFNKFKHGKGLEDPKITGTSSIHSASLHRWPMILSKAEADEVWARTADLWKRIDPEVCYCKETSCF